MHTLINKKTHFLLNHWNVKFKNFEENQLDHKFVFNSGQNESS